MVRGWAAIRLQQQAWRTRESWIKGGRADIHVWTRRYIPTGSLRAKVATREKKTRKSFEDLDDLYN